MAFVAVAPIKIPSQIQQKPFTTGAIIVQNINVIASMTNFELSVKIPKIGLAKIQQIIDMITPNPIPQKKDKFTAFLKFDLSFAPTNLPTRLSAAKANPSIP